MSSKLHFYYDESNNIRTFRIKTNRVKPHFNSNINEDFVLGGVVSEGDCDIDFSKLKALLNLQNNVMELKFKKHFAKENFMDCINSERLEKLLNFVYEKGLYIHYVHVNNLFYALADIIDSLPGAEIMCLYGRDFSLEVKSAFYGMMEKRIPELTEILYTYKFPNIESGKEKDFCDAILLLTRNNEHTKYDTIVNDMLNEGKNSKELVFIQDNKDYEMQEDYSVFYSNRIVSFNKDIHTFDKELSIQTKVEEQLRMQYESLVPKFEFVDSIDCVLVQISDVLVGVLGKMYSYLNKNNEVNVEHDVSDLNSLQRRNLSLLNKLILKSDKKNKLFLQSVTATHKRNLGRYLFNLNSRNHMDK